MSIRARLWLLLATALAAAQTAGAADRPTSYAEFDASIPVSSGRALKAAIEGGTPYIFVRRGTYVLDNPVVIDRGHSLFVHGADRTQTSLVAADPTQPLFIVKRAPLVNFAGLLFVPARDAPRTANSRAIVTRNREPLVFEMLDCGVGSATLAFEGPGRYQIQTPILAPHGRVRAAVWVDHPDADVLVFAGDATNAREPLRSGDDDFAFVWQKRGRVRVHAMTVQGGLGQGDVRIESASKLGPHVIANVRSEGVSGPLAHTGAVSRFLYVPPTSEPVDVVLKANGGAWDTGPRSGGRSRINCSMIAYHGAGTVWLIGNRAEGTCGRHIAEGKAPAATIVSVGNLISSPEAFAIQAKRIISAEDAFHSGYWTGNPNAPDPAVRWIPDGAPAAKLSSIPNVPAIPDDVLPPALSRPRMTAALPDMIDVKSEYGAVGDGKADDTRSIQKALDARCDGATPTAIFFPAGTYRVTETLYLSHHAGGKCRRVGPYGGWIAGAGSSATVIRMDRGLAKGVFASDGLASATIQGLTFQTFAYRPGDPPAHNFEIECRPGFVASQLDTFFDVVLDGGFGGLALGVKHPTAGQCSSIVMFGSEIKNAHIGLISGHFNALANGVVGTLLADNDYALGSWTDTSNQGNPPAMPPGGTFFAYDSVSRGTRIQDFLFAGSANGSAWYFYGYRSDAPRFFASKPTSAAWPILFDRARLTPRPGAEYLFDVASAQGPIFLHSTATRSAIRIGQTSMAQSYAIKLHSQIADWSAAVAPTPRSDKPIPWTDARGRGRR